MFAPQNSLQHRIQSSIPAGSDDGLNAPGITSFGGQRHRVFRLPGNPHINRMSAIPHCLNGFSQVCPLRIRKLYNQAKAALIHDRKSHGLFADPTRDGRRSVPIAPGKSPGIPPEVQPPLECARRSCHSPVAMSRPGFVPTILLALLLTSAAPHFVSAAPLSPEERAAVLAKLESIHSKNPAMTARFVERKTTRLLKEPLVSRGTIAFQTPDKFRREVTGKSPSLSVSNGKLLWIYYPKFKEAERYELGQRDFFDDALAALTVGLSFRNVEKYYRLEAFPEGNGYRIILEPRSRKLRRVVEKLTIHLDGELKVRRTVAQLPKGDRVQTDYTNVHRQSLPTSTFEFTPEEGINVTRPLGK